MPHRLSQRFNITLQPTLVSQLTSYQAEYAMTRSAIIQQALRDWLARQGPVQSKPAADPALVLDDEGWPLVGGQRYYDDTLLTEYLRTGLNTDQQVQIIEQFEAAQRFVAAQPAG